MGQNFKQLRLELLVVQPAGQGCALLLLALGGALAALGLYAISNCGEPMILPVGSAVVTPGILVLVTDGRGVARDRAPWQSEIDADRREKEIRISSIRSS